MDEGGMGRWGEARAKDGEAMGRWWGDWVGGHGVGKGGTRVSEPKFGDAVWDALGNPYCENTLPFVSYVDQHTHMHAFACCCHHLICTCMQLLVYPASGGLHSHI